MWEHVQSRAITIRSEGMYAAIYIVVFVRSDVRSDVRNVNRMGVCSLHNRTSIAVFGSLRDSAGR